MLTARRAHHSSSTLRGIMNTLSWRRRLTAALLIPFLLVLAGCRLHADIEVNSAEDVVTTMDIAIPKSLMETEYNSAAEMCEAMRGEQPSIDDAVPEPYEEGDLWGCRITGQADSSDYNSSFRVTEEDGKLNLVMNFGDEEFTEEDLSLLGISDIDFHMTFSFPGKVLESKGGTIDGNTVTYTDISEFFQGVDIVAEAGGGFPWLIVVIAVVVLGFLLLLALALGAFLFMRSRKKGKTPASAPVGYGSSSAAGAPAVPQAPGAPASPAPGAQSSSPVPPFAAHQGSPAVPPAPQGSHQWNGSAQQSPPAQGQSWGQGQPGQGEAGPDQQWGQAQPGQDQQWGQAQPGQDQQWSWPSQDPQQPPQNPQNPSW